MSMVYRLWSIVYGLWSMVYAFKCFFPFIDSPNQEFLKEILCECFSRVYFLGSVMLQKNGDENK